MSNVPAALNRNSESPIKHHRVLYRSRYDARRVADVLQRLLQKPSYARAAAELGEKVRAEDGTGTAADAIEARLPT